MLAPIVSNIRNVIHGSLVHEYIIIINVVPTGGDASGVSFRLTLPASRDRPYSMSRSIEERVRESVAFCDRRGVQIM